MAPTPIPTPAPTNAETRAVRVWDLPTRAFHWSLVVLVAVAWVSSEARGSLLLIHVYAGTLLVGFVAFRLVWGLIGSRYARFSDFVYAWPTVRDYGQRLLRFRPPHIWGHNPVGGWMVLALLGGLFLAVVSGLMINKDGYTGPLSHLAFSDMKNVHEAFANAVGFLIVVHVLGVLAHGLIARENLVKAMITGNKTPPLSEGAQAAEKAAETGIDTVGWVRPVIAVVAGLAAVWLFLG